MNDIGPKSVRGWYGDGQTACCNLFTQRPTCPMPRGLEWRLVELKESVWGILHMGRTRTQAMVRLCLRPSSHVNHPAGIGSSTHEADPPGSLARKHSNSQAGPKAAPRSWRSRDARAELKTDERNRRSPRKRHLLQPNTLLKRVTSASGNIGPGRC